MKEKLLISFSGGRTSAYMTQWLLKNMSDKHEIIVVFANTGEEEEATLEFTRKCDEHFGFNTVWVEAVPRVRRLINGKRHIFTVWGWKRIERRLKKDGFTEVGIETLFPSSKIGVTAKVVNFETANRTGEPFKQMIAKQGIPNKKYPHCSRDLKQRAIRSYAREIGWTDYHTAVGIRSDEVDRISNEREKEKLVYPLISYHPTTREAINKFWGKMPFDLELKSYEGNCKVCWKKSLRKLLTIAKEHPERFEKFEEFEKEFENHVPSKRLKDWTDKGKAIDLPIRFFRGNLSVKDLLDMSKKEFEPVRDESKDTVNYVQATMFGHNLDLGDGCIESCEVF